MTPREDEALIEWNNQGILDVFNYLEQQGNWQVFYQSFEVVQDINQHQDMILAKSQFS